MNYSEVIFLIDRLNRIHYEKNGNYIDRVYIVGSQSILKTHKKPVAPMFFSMELDVIVDDPKIDEEFEAQMMMNSGDLSPFSLSTGLTLDLVDNNSIVGPDGWKERSHWVKNSNEPSLKFPINSYFMDQHDLMLTKLRAGRPKDLDFVNAQFKMESLSHKVIVNLIRNKLNKEFFSDLSSSNPDTSHHFEIFKSRLISLYGEHMSAGKLNILNEEFTKLAKKIINPDISIEGKVNQFREKLEDSSDAKDLQEPKP